MIKGGTGLLKNPIASYCLRPAVDTWNRLLLVGRFRFWRPVSLSPARKLWFVFAEKRPHPFLALVAAEGLVAQLQHVLDRRVAVRFQ